MFLDYNQQTVTEDVTKLLALICVHYVQNTH